MPPRLSAPAPSGRVPRRDSYEKPSVLSATPPFFYRQSDEAIVEHYRVVASAADLPFFVYNLPQCTQVEITPDLMQKIKEKVPQLVGLKHSALDIAPIRKFLSLIHI